MEKQVRNWALKEEKLYVITGPIFSENPFVMGKTEIPVPEAFYKVVLDLTPPMKMIGFIVPNKITKRRIGSFAVSVDEVERLTGYDFFSELENGYGGKMGTLAFCVPSCSNWTEYCSLMKEAEKNFLFKYIRAYSRVIRKVWTYWITASGKESFFCLR